MILRKMHSEFVSEKVKEVKPLVGQTDTQPFHFSHKKKWAGGGGGGRTKYFSVFNKYMHVFNQNYFSTNINTYV
jgi:hypothetical protein